MVAKADDLDVVEEAIGQIMARYNADAALARYAQARLPQRLQYGVSARARVLAKSPPFVWFVETGGRAGGGGGSEEDRDRPILGSDVVTLEAGVYGRTVAECRRMLFALRVAAHNVFSTGVLWTGYEFPSQVDPEITKAGELLVAELTIEVSVPATLEGHFVDVAPPHGNEFRIESYQTPGEYVIDAWTPDPVPDP